MVAQQIREAIPEGQRIEKAQLHAAIHKSASVGAPQAERAKATVAVKQALPYVRLVGESWPLGLKRAWFEHRAAIFLKAADLLAGPRGVGIDIAADHGQRAAIASRR